MAAALGPLMKIIAATPPLFYSASLTEAMSVLSQRRAARTAAFAPERGGRWRVRSSRHLFPEGTGAGERLTTAIGQRFAKSTPISEGRFGEREIPSPSCRLGRERERKGADLYFRARPKMPLRCSGVGN